MEVEVPFGKTLDAIWHSLTQMMATPTSVSYSLEICHCCHRCPRCRITGPTNTSTLFPQSEPTKAQGGPVTLANEPRFSFL